MKKDTANEQYGLISVAFFFVIVVDTMLKIHPSGNIIGAVTLLAAYYKIRRSTVK